MAGSLNKRPVLIINPSSGGGKTRKLLAHIQSVAERHLGEIDVRLTEASGHAIEIAKDEALAGRKTVIAVGGDGSINEVVNGLMLAQKDGAHAELGVLGQGTGGDFRRTLGLDHRLDRYCEVLARGETRPIDIGEFTYADHTGTQKSRYFVNILSVGVSGKVDRLVADSALSGSAAYFVASTRGILESRLGRVRGSASLGDEARDIKSETRLIAICNGQYFGGGMRVAPMADLDDGVFDVVDFGGGSRLAFAVNSSMVYTGRHLRGGRVSHYRVDRIRLSLDNPEVERDFLLDVDGEPLGRLPIEVSLHRRALDVLAPKAP